MAPRSVRLLSSLVWVKRAWIRECEKYWCPGWQISHYFGSSESVHGCPCPEKWVPNATRIRLSDQTVGNRLHEVQLHARRPLVVPRITNARRRARMTWARILESFQWGPSKQPCYGVESPGTTLRPPSSQFTEIGGIMFWLNGTRIHSHGRQCSFPQGLDRHDLPKKAQHDPHGVASIVTRLESYRKHMAIIGNNVRNYLFQQLLNWTEWANICQVVICDSEQEAAL